MPADPPPENRSQGYAELHCLSCFSFQRAASHARELFERARTLAYSALAITDECSLAGSVRAWEASRDSGLPLIVGSELQLEDGPRLVLLVTDKAAYEQLSALITHARRRSAKGEYRLRREDFDSLPQSGLALWLPDADPSMAQGHWLRDHFPGRSWIAVELHRGPGDRKRLQQLSRLGKALGLPLVASGDVRYHAPERRPLHDVMTAIRTGRPIAQCGYALLPNAERHLRRIDALQSLYPQALLDETLRIARRCHFRMDELRSSIRASWSARATAPAAG